MLSMSGLDALIASATQEQKSQTASVGQPPSPVQVTNYFIPVPSPQVLSAIITKRSVNAHIRN